MLESLSDADSTIDTASFIKAIKKILSATTANKSTHLRPFKGFFNLSAAISILLDCCQQLIAQRIKNSVCKFTFGLTFFLHCNGIIYTLLSNSTGKYAKNGHDFGQI